MRCRKISINTYTHTQGDFMLKRMLKGLWDILESLGRARAAATLARNGRYKEAQDLFRN